MIALLAIYLPILRKEIESFVSTWNSHQIRKQKGRPNVVAGRPFLLYNYPPPNAVDFGRVVDKDELKALLEEAPKWDMHAILPAATQAWVDQQFLEMGFDPSAALLDTIDDREDPFYSVYINLRNRLITYVDLGAEPSLNTRAHPVGAWNFQVYT